MQDLRGSDEEGFDAAARPSLAPLGVRHHKSSAASESILSDHRGRRRWKIQTWLETAEQFDDNLLVGKGEVAPALLT